MHAYKLMSSPARGNEGPKPYTDLQADGRGTNTSIVAKVKRDNISSP